MDNNSKVKIATAISSLNLKLPLNAFGIRSNRRKLIGLLTASLVVCFIFYSAGRVFFGKRQTFVNPNPWSAKSLRFSEATTGGLLASEKVEEKIEKVPTPKTSFGKLTVKPTTPPTATPAPIEPTVPLGNTFSVLLLGLDRRAANEFPYRTDALVLATVSEEKKKILLTSLPRDLWVEGQRINAVYTSLGIGRLKEIVREITGVAVDRYVDCDFDDFVWVINNFGGIEVKIERTFTDPQYPSDREGGGEFLSITFEQGLKELDGETALKYVRSRHGNNSEGSDFARSSRQQNLLLALPAVFLSGPPPFEPFSSQGLFDLARTKGIKTDLNIEDIIRTYSMIQNSSAYSVDRFVVDYQFLYSPPMSEYGGAWVLLPKGGSYMAIHEEIKRRLSS